MKIPNDTSADSRDGCSPLPTSMWSDLLFYLITILLLFYLLLLAVHLLQENISRNTFRRLLLKRKKDIFNNYNINDTKRCLHGIQNLQSKRYLMKRSSCLLLNLLFWFVKVSLKSEAIVVFLKKRVAGCYWN